MKRLLFFVAVLLSLAGSLFGREEGNDCLTAIPVVINSGSVGGVINNGETWWYILNLPADYQNVEIESCLSTAAASCIVDLYSDCSTFLVGGSPNVCNPGNPNEMISLPGLTAGIYYIKVTGGGTSNGAFTLNVTGTTNAVFDDLSVVSIHKPVKNFEGFQTISVEIANHGVDSQTAFPVSYILNGDTVTEIYVGTINGDDTVQYDFLTPAIMGNDMICNLVAKTNLSADENTDNDSCLIRINTYINENVLSFLYDDYVSVPDDPALNFSGNFTVEAWLYSFSTKSKGPEDLLSKHENNGGRKGYAIEYFSQSLKVLVGADTGWVSVSYPMNTDEWHHVAMVYDSGTLKMYLDSVFCGSAYGSMMNSSVNFYIGGSQQYGNNWTGSADEIRIWSRAKSEQEIWQDMNREISPDSADLVAYYDFNRGISAGGNTDIGVLPDMTDNNHHGTMHNFLLTNGTTMNGNFYATCDVDLSAPVPDSAFLPDVTAVCGVSSLVPPTATDNCNGQITGIADVPLPVTTQGLTVVTWNYDDGYGHVSFQMQNIIVHDTINPSIICSGNQVVTINQGETFYEVSGVLFDPVYTDDNCGVDSVCNNFTHSASLNGAHLPVGLNTIIWTVTDGAGNSDTCVQNIEVEVAIGMESGSRNHQIRVLPNPVGNLAVIDLHDIQFIEIELYDAAGNKAGVFYDTKIDLSAFSKGLYYVKVITAGDVFVTPLVKD
ncbi:MAG: hypothetical protein CVU11_05695 [Bacteroidetes bacterium HGW-Bacteroidetes-6]|jgi:hypothetical protein|nr:MAG: hypothetical protein CVU11_05695 [Bacteroidetes bacterium HGW-Bacteroidetes-6]